jgi:hypothetical protein
MADENKQEFEQEEAVVKQTNVEHVSARTVEIHQAAANMVHADENVTIRQGGAKDIRAKEVSVRQGAVMTIDAENVTMAQGGALLVRTGEAHLSAGTTSAAILGDTVRMEMAGAQFMLARDSVEMDQSAVGILVGQHITAKDSGALVMIADTVEGNVSVVMDRQTAITFGAALGAALGLMLALFGIVRRRK